jgi:HEAT repeat protein
MSKRPPDFCFVRDDRPLSAWLVDLVAEEAPTRLAAGEALQAMSVGVPSVHTKLTEIEWGSSPHTANQGDRFGEAVRTAARAPRFPTRDFVQRLIVYRMAIQDDWRARTERAYQRDKSTSPIEERLIRRIQSASDEPERIEALRRYMRRLCASMNRGMRRTQAIFAGAEAMTSAGFMAATVFEALDEVLLVDRPGLRVMLGHKDLFLSHSAARTLARIGPPAVDFADVFLEQLDAEDVNFCYHGAPALGSIGRDDPVVIDGLLKRLRTGTDAVRVRAAAALGHAGPPLAGRLEIAIDFLLAATDKPVLTPAATEALASVGRDREDALRRVLELAAPKPPRWRTYEGVAEYRYDEAMVERGSAIDALRHFRRFADRVVPVLVDAFDTFEEYDHDWGYHGEHGRLCWVLGAFGSDAAPAVPRLLLYLKDWRTRREDDLEWPKDAFKLLASIGPSAAEALPILEQIRAAQAGGGGTPSDEPDLDDFLGLAILALRSDTDRLLDQPAASGD